MPRSPDERRPSRTLGVLASGMSLALAPLAVLAQGTAAPRLALEGRLAERAASRQVVATSAVVPPRIDGRLDDPAWLVATWSAEFTQREPVEGAAPSRPTEVAFLYDGEALYVGARMRGDSGVRALVTRRDQQSTSEQLVVSLDTWRDRRTAYSFGVTAAGVRLDYLHPSDKESSRDYSYEPVWEARTAIDADGWTAELRIPFSQLRFNRCGAGSACTWGVNVTRLIPARNEEDYLVLVRRTETGWASRFADLVGLDEGRRARRAELVPYATSEAKLTGDVDPRNPFVKRRDLTSRYGADLKLGLGSSLTLDATVNPDFAQVEADPAEVNLTAFETVFPEHRPFFVEGSQLLRAGGPTWFHSRRIGQAPRLAASGDYAERPSSTAIRGAAKVSGRLATGLSIGVLTAVTGPEGVRTWDRDSASFGRATIEPLTSFGVVRLQQELAASGSTVGLIVTDVERDVTDLPALDALLPRRARAGAVDWYLRSPGKGYALSGAMGLSKVAGSRAALLRIQRSSAHYFQRPDARRARLDSVRTWLFGSYLGATFEKLAGRWLWNVDVYDQSPGLELNDAGKLSSTNERGVGGSLSYRQTQPGRALRRWELGVESYQEWNYDLVHRLHYVDLFASTTWANYWSTGLSLATTEPTLRDDLTRGGPLMGRPRQVSVGLNLAGNPARKARWKAYGSYDHDEAGGWGSSAGLGLTVRPGTRWELSADPYWSQGVYSRQYFTSLAGGPEATYGRRYVFAYLRHAELSTRVRVSFALTPDLTLETYAEPFVSSGRYFRWGELRAARGYDLRGYGSEGTTLARFGRDSIVVTDSTARFTLTPADFTALSFRSNVVLRWEWRPGSTAYLVWQQDRYAQDAVGGYVGPAALRDAFAATGENVVALKVSYWLSAR